MKFATILLGLTLVLCTSCKTTVTAEKHTERVTCIVGKTNGDQIVSIWCKGTDNFSTCKDAQAAALDQILFKGITEGEKGCTTKPLVLNPNAKTEYPTYFSKVLETQGIQEFSEIEYKSGQSKNCNRKPHLMYINIKTTKLVLDLQKNQIK